MSIESCPVSYVRATAMFFRCPDRVEAEICNRQGWRYNRNMGCWWSCERAPDYELICNAYAFARIEDRLYYLEPTYDAPVCPDYFDNLEDCDHSRYIRLWIGNDLVAWGSMADYDAIFRLARELRDSDRVVTFDNGETVNTSVPGVGWKHRPSYPI